MSEFLKYDNVSQIMMMHCILCIDNLKASATPMLLDHFICYYELLGEHP